MSRKVVYIAGALGLLLLLLFPVGTVLGLIVLVVLLAATRSIPFAVLFPLLLLSVVVPLAAFVVSGAGTHMSPLMLIPPASPWWLIWRNAEGMEIPGLLIGCAINVLLAACVGYLLDRRVRRRTRDRAANDVRSA
jgi:hypothetical protein